MTWTNAADRLPATTGPYLVQCQLHRRPAVIVAYFHRKARRWWTIPGEWNAVVTHWMPLPGTDQDPRAEGGGT